MATVDLAEREYDGATRRVAVKRPHDFLAADPDTVAAFEDEALLGASIHHPNVVRVLELVRGTDLALVLEWVDGMDLAAVVREAQAAGRRLPVDVSAAIVCDLLAGLQAAHDCRCGDAVLGIVHRDVSPQNVLVGFDGVTRLTDFGVAKAAGRQQHTDRGAVKGKLGYLAPEQLGGASDRRTDIHAAGVVLWELLSGTRMRSGDAIEILVAILHGEPRPPSSLAPDAACLDEVVIRALARDPEDRFSSAAAMAEAIERATGRATQTRVAAIMRELAPSGDPARQPAPSISSRAQQGARRWSPGSAEKRAPRAPSSGIIRTAPALGNVAGANFRRLRSR